MPYRMVLYMNNSKKYCKKIKKILDLYFVMRYNSTRAVEKCFENSIY